MTLNLGHSRFYNDCSKEMMRPFINSLDVVNRTAYVVNQNVLNVVKTIFLGREEIGEPGGDISVSVPSIRHHKSAHEFIKTELILSHDSSMSKIRVSFSF